MIHFVLFDGNVAILLVEDTGHYRANSNYLRK